MVPPLQYLSAGGDMAINLALVKDKESQLKKTQLKVFSETTKAQMSEISIEADNDKKSLINAADAKIADSFGQIGAAVGQGFLSFSMNAMSGIRNGQANAFEKESNGIGVDLARNPEKFSNEELGKLELGDAVELNAYNKPAAAPAAGQPEAQPNAAAAEAKAKAQEYRKSAEKWTSLAMFTPQLAANFSNGVAGMYSAKETKAQAEKVAAKDVAQGVVSALASLFSLIQAAIQQADSASDSITKVGTDYFQAIATTYRAV